MVSKRNLLKLLPADEAVTVQVKLPEGCLHLVHALLQLGAELLLLDTTATQEAGLGNRF